jgi:hypothetical protein
MTSGALHGTGRLFGLGDFHMAGHALLVGLLLALGKGKVALLGLVLGVALGTVLLLARRRGNHLG